MIDRCICLQHGVSIGIALAAGEGDTEARTRRDLLHKFGSFGMRQKISGRTRPHYACLEMYMARNRCPGKFGDYLADEIQFATLLVKSTTEETKNQMMNTRRSLIDHVMNYRAMLHSEKFMAPRKCVVGDNVVVELIKKDGTRKPMVEHLFSNVHINHLDRMACAAWV